MEKRELTCIGCPLGCSITVTLENGEIKDVTGYTCKRGHDYARKEVTNPTRIVTSTVRLTGSATGAAVVSCKTAQDIPKGKIFEIVVALRQVTAHAPVKIGDVLLSNAAGTGVDIIATKNVQIIGNEPQKMFTNPFGFVHSSDMIGRYTHTRKQANLFFPLFSFFFLFYTNRIRPAAHAAGRFCFLFCTDMLRQIGGFNCCFFRHGAA